MGFGSDVVQHRGKQAVHFGPALLVQNAAQQQGHLAPFGVVDAFGFAQQDPPLLVLQPAGDGAGGQEFLEREVPVADLVAAADDNAAVQFFRVQESCRPLDGVPRHRAGVEFGRQRFRRPALGDLDRPALEMALHGQGQLREQGQRPIGGVPAGSCCPRAGQPDEDGFVQVGALFRQPPFVPMHDRQRGEHHGVAGHAANLRAGPQAPSSSAR